MMVVIQAGNTLLVNLFAQRFLTKIKQGPGKLVNELGMALETQHLDRKSVV